MQLQSPTLDDDCVGRNLSAAMREAVQSDAPTSNDVKCAFALSRCTSRAISELYDLVLAPSGLKCTQFLTLKAIDEFGEIAQYDFSRKYLVAIETLSRNFGSLRRKGLVKVHTGSKREQIYALTERGRQALSAALPYWERAQDRLKQTLGVEDWELLLKLCDRITVAANHAEQRLSDSKLPQPTCARVGREPAKLQKPAIISRASNDCM